MIKYFALISCALILTACSFFTEKIEMNYLNKYLLISTSFILPHFNRMSIWFFANRVYSCMFFYFYIQKKIRFSFHELFCTKLHAFFLHIALIYNLIFYICQILISGIFIISDLYILII